MSKKKEQESQKAAPQKEETSGSPAQELTWEKEKKYSPQEAVQLTKKLSKTKFDASVEVHLRLGIDPKKGDQQVRSTVTLPHGTGKQTKVAAFVSPENQKAVKEAGADIVSGEDLIEEIKK